MLNRIKNSSSKSLFISYVFLTLIRIYNLCRYDQVYFWRIEVYRRSTNWNKNHLFCSPRSVLVNTFDVLFFSVLCTHRALQKENMNRILRPKRKWIYVKTPQLMPCSSFIMIMTERNMSSEVTFFALITIQVTINNRTLIRGKNFEIPIQTMKLEALFLIYLTLT